MRLACFLLAASLLPAQPPEPIPIEWRAAINRISPHSLEGNVHFLSSDLLEGRATPSRGQDIAAEFIAAQFRRFHLEPAGDHGSFFHSTPWRQGVSPTHDVTVEIGSARATSPAVSVIASEPVHLTALDAVLWQPDASSFDPDGKVAVFLAPPSGAEQLMGSVMQFLSRARPRAKALVIVDPSGILQTSMGVPKPRRQGAPPPTSPNPPLVFIHDAQFAATLAAAPSPTRASIHAPALSWRDFPLRNVVALLPGADPLLRDTYIVLSAHYDHVGVATNPNPAADSVFNGANDNASGVAALLEIASTLAAMPIRPKRSILFVAFAGEEIGLLGSRDFARHGPIPPSKIIANLNLEVLGRTDAQEAAPGRATVTGFSYTTLSATLLRAAQLTGISIGGEERYSSAFFNRSDNISFAEQGIPAVTISNGYLYPEYHGLNDEAAKLDYPQMAAITRMVTAATLLLASSSDEPAWTGAPAAKPYRDKRPQPNSPVNP
jgi:hypothetical protein